jgi:predicted PurR-regulated permease PerM
MNSYFWSYMKHYAPYYFVGILFVMLIQTCLWAFFDFNSMFVTGLMGGLVGWYTKDVVDWLERRRATNA